MIDAFRLPDYFKQEIDGIARDYQRAMRMPREIEQLLAGLAPYASEAPVPPTPEMLSQFGRE